tara:strand:+ start:194 stop:844 length:651 start_codon:yes stop_codon:yes gene_type:complete
MDQDVIDNYPVLPTKKVLPKWFKELPTEKFAYPLGSTLPTIKKCMPATDMLTSGYIIQNVIDVDVIKEKTQGNFVENRIKVKDTKYAPEAHRFEMCPVKNPDSGTDKQHWIKLKNPWLVRTPPGYSCLFIQPVYEFNPNLRLLSGIVDTDTFDLPVEFPGWIVNDHIIKAGQPLMQVIPFKREDWNMSMEFTDTHDPKMTDDLRYKDLFHVKKKFN